MEFDHVGVPASERRDGMRLLESRGVWLSSPADHPFRIEWLFYEPESPEVELIRTVAHVAYRVENLEEAMEGYRVIAEPFDVFGEARASFIEADGAPVEFVQVL